MQNYALNEADMRERVIQDLQGKNWLATWGLLLLLGSFGAHRFYTGKTGSAIAMLILTCLLVTAPIAGIWVIIDYIMLTLGVFKAADGDDLYEPVYWLAWIPILIGMVSFLFWLVFGHK